MTKLPSVWAQEGFYVIDQNKFTGVWFEPKMGDDVDYYDRCGTKRYGRVVTLTDTHITFKDHNDRRTRKFKLRRGR